jgi:hypothetical protein
VRNVLKQTADGLTHFLEIAIFIVTFSYIGLLSSVSMHLILNCEQFIRPTDNGVRAKLIMLKSVSLSSDWSINRTDNKLHTVRQLIGCIILNLCSPTDFQRRYRFLQSPLIRVQTSNVNHYKATVLYVD